MSVELSHEKLEELRKIVKEDLEKVPEGMHKPIAPEVMDKLIFKHLPRFDGKVIKNNSGFSNEYVLEKLNSILSQAKVPIWTGDFLSKVDMSGVSFEGAVLDFDEIDKFFRKFERKIEVKFDKIDILKYIKKVAKYYHHLESRSSMYSFWDFGDSMSDFRDISFEYEEEYVISFNNAKVIADFSNTNVSFKPSELFIADRAENEVGYSKLSEFFDYDMPKKYVPSISYCSFANADLGCKDWGHVYLENCDLSNTGAVIKIDTRKSEVVNGARSCELVGCVVNGKPVERKKITPDKKEAILAELGDLQAQYMAAINVEAVPKAPRR